MKQMVLVKGENIHLRFERSPSVDFDIPLKKRRNGATSRDIDAAKGNDVLLAANFDRP